VRVVPTVDRETLSPFLGILIQLCKVRKVRRELRKSHWVNSEFEKVKMVKVEKERELAIRELSISGSGSCAQNDVD
jgi:hypothetical protein